MDGPANPTAPSRIDSRYRYQPQNLPQQRLPVPDLPHPDEQLLQARRDERPRTRKRMTRGHHSFHRRAGLANVEIVTVQVIATVDEHGSLIAQQTLAPVPPPSLPDVVATAAAVLSATTPAQGTHLPLPSAANMPAVPPVPLVPNVPVPALPPVPAPVPAIPSVAGPALPPVVPPAPPAVPDAAALPPVPVPAPPTVPAPALPPVGMPVPPSVPVPVLPSVPAVPPFPTDLVVPSVPAYPFPTLNPVAQAVAISTPINASPVLPSEAQGYATPSSVPAPAPVSAINSATNMTLSSTSSLLPFSSLASLDSISASASTELVASINAVPTRSASDSQSLPSSTRTSSTRTLISSQSVRSIATSSDATSTTAYFGGGGNTPGFGGAPVPTTSATSNATANSSPSALETPKVIGSVLGSLAGVALILALILLLLKRHKQKRSGALQLTGDDHADNHRSMSQAPTTSSALVPIAFLNRFSGLSGKTAETSTSGGERSFQRVSGRKLPSAFSEGLTSDQFSRGGTMSGSSFYQDDHGVYGGPAMSKEFGKEIGDTSAPRESGQMNIRPSPARTPIIRHPDDGNPFSDRNHLSPPQSPVAELPPRGTLGRSLPSADGSRSSKFTENV